MTFSVIVKNLDGSLEWDLPYSSFSFTEELNKGKSASFSFDMASVQTIANTFNITVEYIFSASYREIEVYDADNNKIYYGYISEVQFTKNSGQLGSISVTSKGFFNILEKRITGGADVYTSDDSADIAWDLISDTQAKSYGDLGITRGSHPATKTRDRTFRYKTVAEAIRKMSANEVSEGYDFDINNSKQFNIYYPKGSTKSNIFLTEGFNIDSYQIYKTFIDGMANSVTVVGSGVDETNQLVEVRNSANSYKEAFFLLEEMLSESDVTEATTLQDKGDAYLDEYQAPRYTIALTCRYNEPQFTDYEVGDWLNVEIPSFGIDTTYRVRKITCNNLGTVSLTLSDF